jgi:hypothetical protein
MWKIAVVLILTALAMLGARLAYDPSAIYTRVGAFVSDMRGGASAPLAPPLMYAGVRG